MLYRIPEDILLEIAQDEQIVFGWVAEKGKSSDFDMLVWEIQEEHEKSVCVRVILNKDDELIQKLKCRTGDVCFLYQNEEPIWHQYMPDRETIEEKIKEAKDIRKNPKPPADPLQSKKKSVTGL